MKKYLGILAFLGGLLFVAGKVTAGLPLDQLTQPRTSSVVPTNSTAAPSTVVYSPVGNWNTSILGSSAPAAGSPATVTLGVVQTTMSFNGGVTNSTFSARNCITDLTLSLSNGSTFYLLDGGTTDYVVYGAAILPSTTSTSATWTKHWDHLGPWCGTAGSATTLSIPTPGPATQVNAINVEGYSVITGLAAVYNANQ